MPLSDRPLVEQRPAASNPTVTTAEGGLISSPDLNREAEPRQHAIRDIMQVREVVRTIQQANRLRSLVASRLMAKVNCERPNDQKQLEQEGLGWRQNFSTRPLASTLEKVFPRFIQAVDGLKYLTNSSLDADKWDGAVEKTELFRKAITDTIRANPAWKTLIADICFTNTLFGSAVVAVLNEFSYFPRSFRHEDVFLTDGCKQDPAFAQVVVVRETLMPHELFSEIKDRESAETIGWKIPAAIEAINNASPAQIRESLGTDGNLETWYQNAIRELTVGASYMAGANVISVYNLLVTEVTGKVSMYKLAGEDLSLIYEKDDRFDSPQDFLAFYSFERGNGTMHGSKGLGRQIYELAGMLDRARNEMVDRSILSGKTLVQGDIKRLHTFKMSVVGSTCIIPNGWNVLQQRIDGDVEPFLRLDAYFSTLVDQIVGNVSPPQLAGSGEAMRSSAAWQVTTAREEEAKDARIVRFMENFVSMIQMMQRRMCRKGVHEKAAKEMQEKLLTRMSREELDELAEQPVAGTVRDLTPLQRQMIVAVAAEKRGNPLYNQRALEVEDLTARLDTQFADRVLLPVEDPTEEAEQTRLQLMEIVLLSSGQEVPVSPRDNPLIHLQVILPATEQLAGQIMNGEMDTGAFKAMIAHVTAHVATAESLGIGKDDPILKQAKDLVKNAGAAIAQLEQLDAQAAQIQQASGGLDASHPDLQQQPTQ